MHVDKQIKKEYSQEEINELKELEEDNAAASKKPT